MIAIHQPKERKSFFDRWLEYCKKNDVPFKLVNVYDNDIIKQLDDCDGFMWHWHHKDYRDQLFARQLLLALESAGKRVYPNSNTCWHFDDKMGQKYLLEAHNLPLVPTYCFFDYDTALGWIAHTDFPKVFKLRNGAASQNVQLVKNKAQGKKLLSIAFGKGFGNRTRTSILKEAFWRYKRDKDILDLLRIIKTFILIANHPATKSRLPVQKNYIYFQDFIPNNQYDDRLVVIGNRCFCVRRHCRSDDFRASGSGVKSYDTNLFPKETIKLAFTVAKCIKSQSCAMDFVYTDDGKPCIVELSYGFITGSFYEDCHGYFDSELDWHDVPVRPEQFIIEDFLKDIAECTAIK
jgi:glutathione synthase/RimK-type ligase-like ATP-grasp enzyme